MVIFDTTVLIGLYRGNVTVKESIEKMGVQPFFISCITSAEFMVGAKNADDLKTIENHLGNYTVLPLNEGITQIFQTLIQTHLLAYRPGIADTLIAATALYYDLPLFTHNKKHFQHMKDLRLV